MNETKNRVIRTFFQLVAGGGLTALINQVAKDIPTAYVPYLLIGSTLLVTLVQNVLEDQTGKSILK